MCTVLGAGMQREVRGASNRAGPSDVVERVWCGSEWGGPDAGQVLNSHPLLFLSGFWDRISRKGLHRVL